MAGARTPTTCSISGGRNWEGLPWPLWLYELRSPIPNGRGQAVYDRQATGHGQGCRPPYDLPPAACLRARWESISAGAPPCAWAFPRRAALASMWLAGLAAGRLIACQRLSPNPAGPHKHAGPGCYSPWPNKTRYGCRWAASEEVLRPVACSGRQRRAAAHHQRWTHVRRRPVFRCCGDVILKEPIASERRSGLNNAKPGLDRPPQSPRSRDERGKRE